ncbi:TPA: hypothetical protein RQK90_004688 [Vibrio vulnificus]|uniref:hypothetical protein n=1 Tax=Vibrio vulnificus TaxID=672 RepID=UPI0009BB4C2A|nr:hypothetical protein [Vibrio vulnificus]HDY8067591.1 hypothetical protein [Vibrio vulnificus]
MENSLFSGESDWQNNACMNWNHQPLGLYIEGYWLGANKLVDDVVKSSTNQDTLVYPICFLYRQYIELQLKQFIQFSRILLSEGNNFPQNHKISSLWEVLNGLMLKVIKQYDESIKEYITKEDVAEIRKIIKDFHAVDPDSFSFRYHETKDGQNTLDGLDYINLRKLSDAMNKLHSLFEKYLTVLSLLMDYRNDMIAEYRT